MEEYESILRSYPQNVKQLWKISLRTRENKHRPNRWDRVLGSISVAGLAYVKLCNIVVIPLALCGAIDLYSKLI